MLEDAASVDDEEAARIGKSKRGDELPSELGRPAKRWKRKPNFAPRTQPRKGLTGGKPRNQAEKMRWHRAKPVQEK